MITIVYLPSFVKSYKDLGDGLRKEVREKISLFRDRENHKILKVHKLHGRLSGRYSFSVNHSFRIIFEYVGKNSAAMLAIGDHDIYK